MFIPLNAMMLAALIWILLKTHKPFVCSGIYTVAVFFIAILSGQGILPVLTTCRIYTFFIAILSGQGILPVLIACIIVFILSSVYFFLLQIFNGRGFIWWLIAVLGFGIGLV